MSETTQKVKSTLNMPSSAPRRRRLKCIIFGCHTKESWSAGFIGISGAAREDVCRSCGHRRGEFWDEEALSDAEMIDRRDHHLNVIRALDEALFGPNEEEA